MAGKPVLDLGSLNPERPFIAIDGTNYRYRVQMDLSLAAMAKMAEIDRRLAPKALTEEPTEADVAEFSAAIDEGVRLVMYDPIPDDVLGKLNEVAKLAILEHFPRATQRAKSPLNRKARRAMGRRRSTLPSSSPA